MRKVFLGMVAFGIGWLAAHAAHAAQQTNDRLADAQALGWLIAPNVCGGYFADPVIPGSNHLLSPIKTTITTISADSSKLQYNGLSTLEGHVLITQPGRIVSANQANFFVNNGNYEHANLQGHVLLREQGKVAIGQTAWLNLQDQTYSLTGVIYRLFLSKPDIIAPSSPKPLSAWGSADNITQPPSGITTLQNVTYSTCPPESRAWDLHADQIQLNQNNGRGYAYGATMYSHGVPFFYMPYFNFPIDNRRQTGFLYPQLSFASKSGYGIGMPFYWNIAPNMDDTVTPTIYVKRGLFLNNQYRYLSQTSSGVVNAGILPNDRAFQDFQQTEPYQVPANTPALNDLQNASATRHYFSWQNHTQFNDQWVGMVNYNRVSDDYYLQDLGGVPTVAQNQLLRQAQATYTSDNWQLLGNVQSYQTLHPVDQASVSNQYSMLPQLLFTSHLPVNANTVNYQWRAEFVNFVEAPSPGQTQTPPLGQRANFVPGINFPLSNALGYVTPNAQFALTQYDLGDLPPGEPNLVTRALPMINVDSGLFFERDINYFGHDYTQTLMPRLFYLYVPFHDQSNIPVFDSSLQPFSYDQLFFTNRFTGADRISDANQLSMAISTQFLDKDTGMQQFSASAGIIKYFANRRVTLCTTPGCVDPLYAIGSTSSTEPTSPIVGQATYHINPVWQTTVGAAWDPNNTQTQNASINFQYLPAPNHVVNLGYQFIRFGDMYNLPTSFTSQNNLSEPTASFAWPLNDRWSALGSWSYSWNRNHALTYFGGVEYDSCCWAIQVVAARTYNALNTQGVPQFNNGVYVQWVFKGLAKVAANDPTQLLLTGIPGYHNNFNAI